MKLPVGSLFGSDMGFEKELLILGLVCVLMGSGSGNCPTGLQSEKGKCVDYNECEANSAGKPGICGNDSKCFNTHGSYYCQCNHGFENSKGIFNFTSQQGQCIDTNECLKNKTICDNLTKCENQIGSYKCTCQSGYIHVRNTNGTEPCEDINECKEAENKQENICGDKGTCKNTDGSYWCRCETGYTNYDNERTPCSKLNCDSFTAGKHSPSLGGLADILSMMRNSCLALSDSTVAGGGKADGEALLEKLLTATDSVLAPGPVESSKGVSRLLDAVENSILLIGPQLKINTTKMDTKETIAQIAVKKGKTRPTGPLHLTSGDTRLSTDWSTAAGTGPYPGFALAALLNYKNLEGSMNKSFEKLKDAEEDDVSFQVFSKVVSVVVSNPSTQNLSSPVNITFKHLQNKKETPEVNFICAYWSESGFWSTDGCSQQESSETHTVCKCDHLSSFAVLMALYPMEPIYELQVVTKVGLIFSLVCLVLSILTFKFCRSIQGTRTTIHLHLCICLFMADLIFLVGISQTEPEGGCKFVAAMLHFFFLGVMAWMLLEGVQLYRMVVLVFNATIRPLYLYLFGYGVPLAIVIISAIIRPKGYGTKQHCWLSLEDGLIWSFFAPVCIIVVLNVFFFIITVWKLAQKFASLNPDLSKLHKIKAFTVTSIAQMCILGLMWVFGAFLFHKDTIVVAYIFTILNSLQGALVFIMHCLLSKQVREEYAQFLSCICTPQKKRYSDFSSTNPSSSQSQGSRSGQLTGESHI
ncbi:adhesion G protein-coupled receptor E2 [Kryptolebias marmoratus]|uniref:Adhesion G protein-coupled receptor E2-like n=1 Tax=Kryptolebias marmoratus TaxID=37003 RepID=A0A3Q3BAI6_KRYMA|nr:adhesion G protein-coupled receptor E2 [Kryptolebias marmoratus]